MNTYLLTWNPAKWTFQDWPQALSDLAQQGFYIRQWSCVSKKAAVGDAILLKKTGHGLKGIIASGNIISPPFNNRHWSKDKSGLLKQYITVKFDRLANYTNNEILLVNDRVDFGYIAQASGCILDETKATTILQRFHDYVAAPVIAPVIVTVQQKRLGVSASLRYAILDRDAHRCIHCGIEAPAIELHVDHIISQAEWREQYGDLTNDQDIAGRIYHGVNDPFNLAASCSPCNLGKSAASAVQLLSKISEIKSDWRVQHFLRKRKAQSRRDSSLLETT